jgi:FAD/FMN-containing dehydrogenase
VEALGENKAIYGTLPEGFGDAYFSARQREVVPVCVIQPSSPQDVSTVIRIINQNSCHFAVKSGGHAMFAGASNAIGGITIDLKYLNEIELSQDHEIAMIGPGNRWGEVYKILEPQGLTVVGGRASTVGVGGFMLGGKSIITYQCGKNQCSLCVRGHLFSFTIPWLGF